MLSPSWRQVTHALLTRPPLSIFTFDPKISAKDFSLDLHVLGTPPAFVLSQDQTLVDFVIYSWLPPRYILHQLNSLSLFSITSFFKVRFNFLELTRSFLTLCNCRNVMLSHLHYRFLTVYFSNIIYFFLLAAFVYSFSIISFLAGFVKLSLPLSPFLSLSSSPRHEALLSYHILSSLSTFFLILLQIGWIFPVYTIPWFR